MIVDSSSCFTSASQGLQIYGSLTQDHHHRYRHHVAAPQDTNTASSAATAYTHSSALLYSLSLLKDKVHQVQSLVTILIESGQARPDSTSLAIAGMGSLIQEIIGTATSMMFSCQQMALLGSPPNSGTNNHSTSTHNNHPQLVHEEHSGTALDWYGVSSNYAVVCKNNENCGPVREIGKLTTQAVGHDDDQDIRKLPHAGHVPNLKDDDDYDIVELNAEDLLAKYTHYCQICGKGFKRDANLRMHMRAHGDEYKTSAALRNSNKNNNSKARNELEDAECNLVGLRPKKYSCPQEGCRWNQRHPKFQPLKSMICVKNHYKRSHCPKMYVCKRCNRKQFSVLSDLRTHEKHCGNNKWQCSCGTTFSRKDKLMGHVALFLGHSPSVLGSLSNNSTPARVEHKTVPIMQIGGIAYDGGVRLAAAGNL